MNEEEEIRSIAQYAQVSVIFACDQCGKEKSFKTVSPNWAAKMLQRMEWRVIDVQLFCRSCIQAKPETGSHSQL